MRHTCAVWTDSQCKQTAERPAGAGRREGCFESARTSTVVSTHTQRSSSDSQAIILNISQLGEHSPLCFSHNVHVNAGHLLADSPGMRTQLSASAFGLWDCFWWLTLGGSRPQCWVHNSNCFSAAGFNGWKTPSTLRTGRKHISPTWRGLTFCLTLQQRSLLMFPFATNMMNLALYYNFSTILTHNSISFILVSGWWKWVKISSTAPDTDGTMISIWLSLCYETPAL